MNVNTLLTLKNKIEKAKMELAEFQGQKNQLLKQLQEKYDCASLQEAEALLEKYYSNRINKLEQKIQEELEELQVRYPMFF